MASLKNIPTLDLSGLHEFHFGDQELEIAKRHKRLFHINRLEDARENIKFPLVPHRKMYHDILLITKGESRRSKGMDTFTFRKNEVFILPAFQITSHESMSKDVEGYFFQFSPSIFSKIPNLVKSFRFLDFHTVPIVALSDKAVKAVLNIFERLIDLYQNGKGEEENRELVLWYIMALFTEINNHTVQEKINNANSAAQITQQFKDSLSQYIYSFRSVREFAQMLHISPNHLNKCVKKTLNTTAQSLLNDMLILEAKSLLKYSDLSVAQIAERLCKSTPSNFSRFFRKQTGMTPNAFKGASL